MFIFILSFVVTVIVSLCFFKSKFWENRYLVLLIGSGVALVATLTTNYIIRGKLATKTELAWQTPIKFFYVNDSVLNVSDSIAIFKNGKYDFNKASGNEFLKQDTSKSQRKLSIVFFGIDKNLPLVGYINHKGNTNYSTLKDIYIAPSESDTIAYMARKKLVYDVKPSNWISGFTFPRKMSYTCLYISPKEYAKLPQALRPLLKKLPF
jgi:protein associated with RNAse G/E